MCGCLNITWPGAWRSFIVDVQCHLVHYCTALKGAWFWVWGAAHGTLACRCLWSQTAVFTHCMLGPWTGAGTHCLTMVQI